MESNRHEQLKDVVSERLQNDGWDVRQEVCFPEGSRFSKRDVIVDVVAERGEKKIAVEVGDIKNRDKSDIESYVDRLVHIPYESNKMVAVERDLHRIFGAAIGYNNIRKHTSLAMIDYIEKMDDPEMLLKMDLMEYDSFEELRDVVKQERVPESVLDDVDSELADLAD